MEEKSELSVVIDGKVYRLSGGSDIYLQKLASYVDGKIRELKKQPGYNKLSTEYRDILLALNITEELFKLRDEIEVFNQDGRDRAQELYELKQRIVDKDMRLDAANKLVADYKAKVNELQKQSHISCAMELRMRERFCFWRLTVIRKRQKSVWQDFRKKSRADIRMCRL